VTLRGQKILKPLFEPIRWVKPAKKKGKSKKVTHKYDHIKQNIIIADNFIEQSELKQNFSRSVLNKNNTQVL
jgi:hypothetical protein